MQSLRHRLTKRLVTRKMCLGRVQSVFIAVVCLACTAMTPFSAAWQPGPKVSLASSSSPGDTPAMFAAQLPDTCISSLRRSEREGFTDFPEVSLRGNGDWFTYRIHNPFSGQRHHWQGIRLASRPLRILKCCLNL